MIKVLLLLAVMISLGFAGYFSDTVSDAERDYLLYCDMVDLWHSTGGDLGWPPYKGECPEPVRM